MDTILDKIILKERRVNCNLDKMWWKWTTHEGLLSFFGPANKIDFRIGGEYEIYFMMDNPEGLRGGEGNKILSYLPKRMLTFSWNAPPEHKDIRNHQHRTWVVVEYKPEDEGRTQIRLSHLGWLKGDKWDAVYDYFDKAWVTVLDWLEESCGAGEK